MADEDGDRTPEPPPPPPPPRDPTIPDTRGDEPAPPKDPPPRDPTNVVTGDRVDEDVRTFDRGRRDR